MEVGCRRQTRAPLEGTAPLRVVYWVQPRVWMAMRESWG